MPFITTTVNQFSQLNKTHSKVLFYNKNTQGNRNLKRTQVQQCFYSLVFQLFGNLMYHKTDKTLLGVGSKFLSFVNTI